VLQTGSATTESENAGLLHAYLVTSPDASSVSTSSVRDRKENMSLCSQNTHRKCFYYELYITKWTSTTVYPYTPEIDGGVP
jgi:hypothetical protein